MLSGKDFIFTSYCFGDQYVSQQERLKQTILSIYPDANIHFYNEPYEVGKAKFLESMYGFKVGLIRDCLNKGFKKIIFFDPAVCLEDKVDYWFDLAKQYGILAVKDNQKLGTVTSDNCLRGMNLTREQVSDWHLVGGSIYVFDFDNTDCASVFSMWEHMERLGLFGSQHDMSAGKLQGHRNDETCMAIAMKLHGVEPLNHDEMKYTYQHPETKRLNSTSIKPIVIKRHFK